MPHEASAEPAEAARLAPSQANEDGPQKFSVSEAVDQIGVNNEHTGFYLFANPQLACKLVHPLVTLCCCAGFGRYQVALTVYAGFVWAADAMEMMLLSFLGPAVCPFRPKAGASISHTCW